jgi:RNA polymerase sigma-70 factor (ECF subfamily)
MINFLTRGGRHLRGSGATSVQELLEAHPSGDPSATALFDHEYKRQLFQSAASEVRSEFAAATWQAFWQTAVEGCAPAEVAAELGLSVGSVYVARSRVLARIRRRVERLGHESSDAKSEVDHGISANRM